eukprot:scaffold145568_cov205-Phaeocystis_antarctica.AAC.1
MHAEGSTDVQLKAGGQGTRGAHSKHCDHVGDTERVEAQRLVECSRVLPSRKDGMHNAGRGVAREAGGDGGGAGGMYRAGLDSKLGA